MTPGLERLLTLTFGKDGNEATHIGNGWSGDEPGCRWMIGQASELWLNNPGPGPEPAQDLILELDLEAVAGDAQKLLVAVRSQAIAQTSVANGGTLGFHIPARMIAQPGPIRLLFIHPDFRRLTAVPGTDDRELALSVTGLRLSRIAPRATVAAGAVLPPAEMIARFESLGDNCEFGLVQRHLGAEPLGLLRFSFIELTSLLRGLRNGFAGLGEAATTELVVDGQDREYVVRDSVFGTTYHTFQFEHQIALEAVRAQQAARLKFLRRKLMEDIGVGEKVFVIKRGTPLRPEEILPLYAALNDLGRNWLLWMLPADATHPAGSIDVPLPGLIRGYVDRFAPYENAHDISHEAWRLVCEKVWASVGSSVNRT